MVFLSALSLRQERVVCYTSMLCYGLAGGHALWWLRREPGPLNTALAKPYHVGVKAFAVHFVTEALLPQSRRHCVSVMQPWFGFLGFHLLPVILRGSAVNTKWKTVK